MEIDAKTLFDVTFEKLIRAEEEALKYQALYIKTNEENRALKKALEDKENR